jgi:hypothetical protein
MYVQVPPRISSAVNTVMYIHVPQQMLLISSDIWTSRRSTNCFLSHALLISQKHLLVRWFQCFARLSF